MRYRPDHKDATRTIILKAGGEVFRARGFAGIGVDGLAKAAKLTSGAFYKHFSSKVEAFREIVAAGMRRVLARVRYVQAARPGANEQEEWIDDFISIYMSQAHRAAVAEGCALPSLTVDVSRSDPETREIYQSGLFDAARAMTECPPLAGTDDGLDRALAILALVAGGTSMARALHDPVMADRVAEAVRRAASSLAHSGFAGAAPRRIMSWEPAS
jgi:AcrR family transcriptional regulator